MIPKELELPKLGWVHKRLSHCAIVNFVSIDGSVSYRIKGQRHSRYSKRENFLKNWRNQYESEPVNLPAERKDEL